jgi:hypothetical protein
VVSDRLLRFRRTWRTSGAETTYNLQLTTYNLQLTTYNQPLVAESLNQRKALILADDMMKDDAQAEKYGDLQKSKRKSSLYLLLQNIQRLSLSIRNQKHEDIVDWIQCDNGDIKTLTEINTYWPKVPVHQQWEERSERLFPQGMKSRFSYNKTETASSNVQYGGAGALAVGETEHRLCLTGEDKTGLGRWVWMRYKGKGGMHLRVVGAYRPNSKGEGENTVYMQHQRYLLVQKDPRDSQMAFHQDLEQAIKTWSAVGDHIVIALDANDDLQNGPVKRLMARQGLQEAILTKHRDKPTVATYNGNHDRKPIDGIFATRDIKITAGGYYAFNEAIQSPHRALWVDIDLDSIFGTKLAPTEKAAARRLKTKDPRVVKKYNKILEKELLRLKLPHRLFLLESKVQAGEITWGRTTEYEEVHQSALHCKANAEQKCRNLNMGKVDWSPEYKAARDRLEVWALLRKKKLGLTVCSRHIQGWIDNTKVVSPWQRSFERTEQELTMARAQYKDTKKQAAELRSAHNDRLYETMAKKQGINAKQMKKNMNQVKRLRKQARWVRRATKKYRTGGLSQVEVQENRRLQTVPVVTKQTESDEFLMPLFVQHGYQDNNLRILNQCRCFLQALTLGDVLAADSRRVCEDSWLRVCNHSRRSEYTWPRTEKPAARHWVMWQQALTKALSVSSHHKSGWNLGQCNCELLS